ncbi:serine/threonine-protein kinase [Streptomyces sp. NPDC018693]|uniref:serine/threonine-protein kinase n=1 Tax=unclassified Streptomyces TaxID=2593676 RepID=UPI00378E79A6
MGEVFAGRYELVDPIGRGGVGAVWRAWDHRRRRYVAAKVLQQSDAHSLLRFVREQALRIDHPHVLAPASWAADDDKVLFTMDLVAGGSLVRLVGDYGPLPPPFVCTLLDQLLSGLAAVHAEGVVHRDIKPANILLEATGTGRPRLRLSDFGISMRLGEPRLTETNLVVGTPGYLAPEQMMGAEPDFPADLFAVGLVGLYLLEGAKPDVKALVQYFAEHGTPGAPQGIPEPLWQVLASLVQPDPQARFRTATGARKALAAAVELLPEPGPDDELIEIFDQLGPLPKGFGAQGPLLPSPGVSDDVRLPTGSDGPTPSSWPFGSAQGTDTGTSTGTQATWPGVASAPSDAGTASMASGWGAAALTPMPASPPTPRPSPTPTHTPTPTPTPSMSDTGSFHLPPPQQQPTPQHHQQPHHQPQQPNPTRHSSPYLPTTTYAPPVREPRIDTSTASYTAQDAQVPTPAPAISHHPAPHGHRRTRRPGPPAKIAVPLLLLALACYAVGFWALSRL